MAEYQAGICNINLAETRSRRLTGLAGIAFAGLALLGLVAAGAPLIARVSVAAPLFIGVLSVLQARNSFCVRYGMSGLQNTREDSTRATKILEMEALTADKKRALQLYVQAALLTLFLTVLAVLILQ